MSTTIRGSPISDIKEWLDKRCTGEEDPRPMSGHEREDIRAGLDEVQAAVVSLYRDGEDFCQGLGLTTKETEERMNFVKQTCLRTIGVLAEGFDDDTVEVENYIRSLECEISNRRDALHLPPYDLGDPSNLSLVFNRCKRECDRLEKAQDERLEQLQDKSARLAEELGMSDKVIIRQSSGPASVGELKRAETITHVLETNRIKRMKSYESNRELIKRYSEELGRPSPLEPDGEQDMDLSTGNLDKLQGLCDGLRRESLKQQHKFTELQEKLISYFNIYNDSAFECNEFLRQNSTCVASSIAALEEKIARFDRLQRRLARSNAGQDNEGPQDVMASPTSASSSTECLTPEDSTSESPNLASTRSKSGSGRYGTGLTRRDYGTGVDDDPIYHNRDGFIRPDDQILGSARIERVISMRGTEDGLGIQVIFRVHGDETTTRWVEHHQLRHFKYGPTALIKWAHCEGRPFLKYDYWREKPFIWAMERLAAKEAS